MAVKTLEKNSIFKFFEIAKIKFFKLIILNTIYVFVALFLFSIVLGLQNLFVNVLGINAIIVHLLIGSVFALIGPIVGVITRLCVDYTREVPGFFLEDALLAFKKNWKQSLIISLLQYVAFIILYFTINFYFSFDPTKASSFESMLNTICSGVSIFAALICVFMSYYLHTMAVTLKLTVREMLKNAFILSFAALLKNILLSVILILWFSIFVAYALWMITTGNAFIWGIGIALLLCFPFGFSYYTISYFSFGTIKKYILDPYYEENPNETLEGAKATKIAQDGQIEESREEQPKSEYVYHNGKMVHRSVLEQETIFSDEDISNKINNFKNNDE